MKQPKQPKQLLLHRQRPLVVRHLNQVVLTDTTTESTSHSTTETTTTNTSSETKKEPTEPTVSSEITQPVEQSQPPQVPVTKQEPEEPIQVPEATNNVVEENQAVSLNPSLKVDEIASSNLKGYELPLLSSFDEQKRAVVVAEATNCHCSSSFGEKIKIKTRWENKKRI